MYFSQSAAVRSLELRLAAEQAEHAKTKRDLEIARAEIESLSLVIARDRERIRAELSAYARQRAENEGDNGRAQ